MLVSYQLDQYNSSVPQCAKRSVPAFVDELSQCMHLIKAANQELADNLSKDSAEPADLEFGVILCDLLLSEVSDVSRRIASEIKAKPSRACASGRGEDRPNPA
ncbi:hypothetical protein GGD83_003270 [Rhodoblastus sphagnicola]|uniref:hypothetical protein n=1 Tax=Rhodoblastus sphagnicola TaxID=333368 RepID=UPI0011B0E53B|nr:hypothetical protein [Rhodoblastus sphagnicola]MBB4199454.1 hypothetical protein [Rhodoblastus sphagnicola]